LKDRRVLRQVLGAGALVFALLSAGFYLGYRADRRFLAQIAEQIDGGRRLTDAQRVEQYVDYAFHEIRNPRFEEIKPWPVRLYYLTNPLHPGPGDVLRWGSDYRGGCGSHSRVVHAALEARGVHSRVLLILDDRGHSIHTVIEALVDGRWIVADPLFGIVYHRRDGALATREDLAADTAFFRTQVDTIPGYDRRYDYDSVTLLNWRKLPIVLPALRSLLTSLLGAEKVKAIARPGIWMWPQAFMSLVCLIVSFALAFSAWRISSRGRVARASPDAAGPR